MKNSRNKLIKKTRDWYQIKNNQFIITFPRNWAAINIKIEAYRIFIHFCVCYFDADRYVLRYLRDFKQILKLWNVNRNVYDIVLVLIFVFTCLFIIEVSLQSPYLLVSLINIVVEFIAGWELWFMWNPVTFAKVPKSDASH